MADLKIMKALSVPAEDVTMEGAEKVTIRWLISKDDGAPNFAMRLFDMEPGGHSPLGCRRVAASHRKVCVCR